MSSPLVADTTVFFASIEDGTPEFCVQFASNPSVHVYHALKCKLTRSTDSWIKEFVEQGGLAGFINSLQQLCACELNNLTDAILQLDCITCISAALNASKFALHYLSERPELIYKLFKCVENLNTKSKKHVYELLCVICVYSIEGHKAVKNAINKHKDVSHGWSSASIIVTELRNIETDSARAAILSLINVLIECSGNVIERDKIRAEFIAHRLLDVIGLLRKNCKDPHLSIQLDLFCTNKHNDDEELYTNHQINYNSHQEVFYDLYKKVLGNPESGCFLTILQDLLLLDTICTDDDRSNRWHNTSKLLHQSLALKDDTLEEFVNEITERYTHPGRCTDHEEAVPDGPSKSVTSEENFHDCIVAGSSAVLDGSGDKKDSGIGLQVISSPYDNIFDSLGTAVSNLPNSDSESSSLDERRRSAVQDAKCSKLHVNPKPKQLTKMVKWVKLETKSRSRSIWRNIDKNGRSAIKLDYKALEQEFCQIKGEHNTLMSDELNLLCYDTRCALNLWLNRLELSSEEAVGYIDDVDDTRLTYSGVKCLTEILPHHEEIAQFQQFKGDIFELGQAEEFIYRLSKCESFSVLLEGLLYKTEFSTKFHSLKKKFEALIDGCHHVLKQNYLKDFLHVMLKAGNFLNTPHYLGNANAFKLNSWQRFYEVTGHRHGNNLLNYLVSVTDCQNIAILKFARNSSKLEIAASYNLEELKTEVTQLNTNLRKLMQQLSTTSIAVKEKFHYFVEDVERDLKSLQESIKTLRDLSRQISLFLCEDESAFSLQQCFSQLFDFCGLVKSAQVENFINKQQNAISHERKSRLRQEQTEKQIAELFGKKANACSSFMADTSDNVVDDILSDIHGGSINQNVSQKVPSGTYDVKALMLSQIKAPATSTPQMATYQPTPKSMDTTFTLGMPEGQRRIFPDRVDMVLGQRFRRDRQGLTASFLGTDSFNSPARVRPPPPYSPLVGTSEKPKKQHRHQRTNSDINHSQNADEKWMTYEQRKAHAVLGDNPQEPRATLAMAESESQLASLSLEPWGKTLNLDDVEMLRMQELETATEDAGKKPVAPETGSRRTSFGFLRRVSRAFTRNSLDAYGVAQPKRDELKRQSKREKQAAKRTDIINEEPTGKGAGSKENKENIQKPKRFDLLRKSKRNSANEEGKKVKSGVIDSKRSSAGNEKKVQSSIPVPKATRPNYAAPLVEKNDGVKVFDKDINVQYKVYRKINQV